jgi:plasmid replication initiation protein
MTRLGPFPILRFNPKVVSYLRHEFSADELHGLRRFLTDLQSAAIVVGDPGSPVARSVGRTTWLIHQFNHIIEMQVLGPGQATVMAIHRDVSSDVSRHAPDSRVR